MCPLNQFGQDIGNISENWTPRKLPHKQTMEGNYCRLEPLDVDLHVAQLFEAFQFNNQGETWTYLPFGPFKQLDHFKEC